MRKRGRLALRNAIVSFLNSKPALGCRVHGGAIPGAKREHGTREKFFSRLVTGISKDGRAIAIYPFVNNRERLPKAIVQHLMEIEKRGGIAGTASHLGDSWNIVFDNESEYPRTQNTKLHLYWARKEEEKHDRTEEE